MCWNDVVMILFSCVAANHLGLVGAVEEVTGFRLAVVNCPRCFSFWSVLIYTVFVTRDAVFSFAASFLAAYLAPWVELLMGITDLIFNRIYDKVYSAENKTDG